MQDEYIAHQQKANKELEERVRERTEELEKVNKQLKIASITDGLTQLANRKHFDETIWLEWRRARREEKPLSVLLCDIDHFKSLNDTYGHQCGDECLRHVGAILNKTTRRAGDSVARYGGEEFVILCYATERDQAFLLAEKIRLALANKAITWLNEPIYISVSIGGCTMFPSSNTHHEQIISFADAAL